MEWLKKILEAATITDGKLDVEALMTSINAEFPKNAVPKDTYNSLSEQLKTASKTISDLKKSNADNETLQNTIKEHEQTITNLKAEAVKQKKEISVKSAFEKAGAKDPDYLIFKNGGVDKFEFNEDGTIKDLDNLIKSSKESYPTIFEETVPAGNGGNPAGGGGNTKKDPSEMTMDEYAEWYKNRNK